MPYQYRWQGSNQAGITVSGIIEANSLLLAKALLRSQGINPQQVRKQAVASWWRRQQKITPLDITLISRQLATMLTAGIPLIQTLTMMVTAQTKPRLQQLLTNIKNQLESGHSLTEALCQHPLHFNKLLCSLVAIGEQTGSLDNMLERIAVHQEKLLALKQKIIKALYYPIAVVLIAMVVTAAMLIFVVPQFAALFTGVGAQLPVMTQVVVMLSQWLQHYGWILLGLIIVSIYSLRYLRRRLHKLAQFFDSVSLKLPITGKILYHAAIARLTRTLAITVAAGLPLLDALNAVAGASGNLIFTRNILVIRDAVTTGQQLHLAMHHTNLFPALVVQMVEIGETSGNLDGMLNKVADLYESNVDTAVDGLSSLLEPVIMTILGILIGGLVVAMYLPIFKLGSVF
jgi:type IV pilus assembly protein PilC